MRLLLIDTCGDTGSIAVAEKGEILREQVLPPRSASAQLVADLRSELGALGWGVPSLDAVGVVSGPGSFTGVRVGMSAAKGLCEVAAIPLVTLSRLELLLAVGCATGDDLAVLDAGRGEFYVRAETDSEELLMGREELMTRVAGGRLLIAEERLMAALAGQRLVLVDLSAAHALPLIECKAETGAEPVDSADANYVRQARGLYATTQGTACAPEPQ